MWIIHIIPAISDEASGPSYSVARLCESLIEEENAVTYISGIRLECRGIHRLDTDGYAASIFETILLAGGPLAVILGFLMVGILQRGLFDGLRHFGGGGLIVLFGLFGTLVNIDNAFNSFFISLIRFLPIFVVAQYVLLQRSRR